MYNWLHKHSLSIGLFGIALALKLATLACEQSSRWYDLWSGMGDDAFGAGLIVVASKHWIEKGSPASK